MTAQDLTTIEEQVRDLADLGTAELRLRLEEVTEQRDAAIELLAALHRAGALDLLPGQVAKDLRRAVLKLVRDVGPTAIFYRHERRLTGVLAPSRVRAAALNAVLHELLDR